MASGAALPAVPARAQTFDLIDVGLLLRVRNGSRGQTKAAVPESAVALSPVPEYEFDRVDRDIIRMALRGDVDLRRYVPEVMRLCARLRITEPPWLEEDASIAERVALNRAEWPKREHTDPT